MKKFILGLAIAFISTVALAQTSQSIYWWTATGTNTYNVQISGITAYSGKWFEVRFTNGNTTSATLSINGGANVTMQKRVSGTWTNLSSGDIGAGDIVHVAYDGTRFQVKLAEASGSGGGSGDVVGPASATDNAVARFDGTTGKLIQNSAFTINDGGAVTVGSWTATPVAYQYGGTGLSTLGTALQSIRVNVGATAYEHFTPTTNPMTTTGDLIGSADNSGTPTRIAAVAANNVLLSQGTGTLPAYGKVGLTTHVDGILPLVNGGTGSALSDPGANRIFIWDDTDNAYVNGVIGANLSYDAGTNTLSASGGGARLDQLTAATGANTINSTSFGQIWQWNSLGGSSALTLSTTSTAAASDLQRMLDISMSGTNATSTQTTVGAYVSNTHGGTASTNIAVYAEASGGATNNYAFKSGAGVVFVGNAAADVVPSNTRFAVRSTGTGTENIVSFMNSGGTARFVVTSQGALTLTNAVQNSVSLNNTFTADATNRHSVNIGGVMTMATTSGSGHIGHLLRVNTGHTTGNTNQELNGVSVDGAITVNSTGVIWTGVNINPSFAGAQTPTKRAIYATSGDAILTNGAFVASLSTSKSGFATGTPLSSIDIAGSLGGGGITSTSTDITLDATHHTVLVDASGAVRTITLPAASTATRREYVIKKTDAVANNVTIDGNGSETIDGATTQSVNTQYAGWRIKCDGSNWYIIGTF